MPSKSYDTLIKEVIMKLTNPNEFEILEYLEDNSAIPNLNISTVRYHLSKLAKANEVVECRTTSSGSPKRYSKRYSLDKKKPKYSIEPIIFKIFKNKKEMLAIAREVNVTKKNRTINGIEFFSDPIRDLVIGVKDNSLYGVIDLRCNHIPKDEVRFPSRFYRQKYHDKIMKGMTELQYFSKHVCKSKKLGYKWLSVNKWGS